MYFVARSLRELFPLLFLVSVFSLAGTEVIVMGWPGRRRAPSPRFISIGKGLAGKTAFLLFVGEMIASRCARTTATGGDDTGFSCYILQCYHPRDAVMLCFGCLCCHMKCVLDLFQFTHCARSHVTLPWSLIQNTRNTNFSTCPQDKLLEEEQKQLQLSPCLNGAD